MLTQTLAFIAGPTKKKIWCQPWFCLEGLGRYWKQRAALQNKSPWIFMKRYTFLRMSALALLILSYTDNPGLSWVAPWPLFSPTFLFRVSSVFVSDSKDDRANISHRQFWHIYVPSLLARCARCWRRSWRSSRRSSTWWSSWRRPRRRLPTRWWRCRSVSAWTSSRRRSDVPSESSAWGLRYEGLLNFF